MGIMSRVLRIADIISTDVRSRSRADIIRNELEENRSNLILDFTDVVFMSRSFTDELYVINAPRNTRKAAHVLSGNIFLQAIYLPTK